MYQAKTLLLTLTALATIAVADEPKKTEAPKPMAAVRAYLGESATGDGYRQLLLYSNDELALVDYKFEETVNDFSPMAFGKTKEGFAYFTTSYLPTKDGQKFLVRGLRKDGSRFTNLVTVKNADGTPSVEIVGYREETKEALAAAAKPAAAPAANVPLSATEADMINAANAYRARAGRGPLAVSPELMNAARAYAASGSFDHGTAGRYAASSGFRGRTTENLARGPMSGAGVVQFWGEPGVGHEQQLAGNIKVNGRWIDGGFTHVGVAGVNGNWIIYFGSAGR